MNRSRSCDRVSSPARRKALRLIMRISSQYRARSSAQTPNTMKSGQAERYCWCKPRSFMAQAC
eukprot:5704246-Heterocapsa_arctica.AAC.1